MPLTSVVAAEDWVRSHSRRKPRACIGSGSAAPPPSENVSPPEEVVPADGEFSKILAEVHTSRAQAYKNLQVAQLTDDGIKTGIASKHFSDAVTTALRTEEYVTEQLKARGELVSMSLAKALINKTLAALTAALDGFPASNAQRCNPSAPLVAETALRESIDIVKQQVQSALASLDKASPA